MFGRIKKIFTGFLSLFISGIEKANPEALIEAEKENLRAQIASFNDNLATHAGFIERLIRQVSTLEKKEKELMARIAANIKAGNREIAGQMALELQTVKSQLEENRNQINLSEETFQKLQKSRDVSVKEAHKKIEQLKRLLSETKMLEAQAELQEMASGMISSIGGSGDTLDRVETYLSERRDKAAGKSRVSSASISTVEFEMKESEQKALAEQALGEFELAFNIQGPATESSSTAEAQPIKDLGPTQSEV